MPRLDPPSPPHLMGHRAITAQAERARADAAVEARKGDDDGADGRWWEKQRQEATLAEERVFRLVSAIVFVHRALYNEHFQIRALREEVLPQSVLLPII